MFEFSQSRFHPGAALLLYLVCTKLVGLASRKNYGPYTVKCYLVGNHSFSRAFWPF